MVLQRTRILVSLLVSLRFVFLCQTNAFGVVSPNLRLSRCNHVWRIDKGNGVIQSFGGRVVRRMTWMEDAEEDEDDGEIDESDFDDPDEMSDQVLLAMVGEWDERIAPYNSIQLTGRIGGDPVARYFDDGKVVVNVNLAVSRKYVFSERAALKVAYGEEETDWFGLEIWGQQAEFVVRFVDKGARVGVVGTLEIDEWNDRETGEIRSRAKVIVRDLDILETKAEGAARRSRGGGGGGYSGGGGGSRGGDRGDDDDSSPAGSGGFFD